MKPTKWGIPAAIAAAIIAFSGTASAQDDEGPITWGEDARYVTATLVKFKPGKRERAMAIIDDHFVPAAESSDTPVPLGVIHYQTGEWDALFVWELDGGTADLEWYRSEDDIKWFAALAEQEGSEDAAEALLNEYQDLVAESETDLGHYHALEEAE